MEAKILLYDKSNGKGTIITKENTKIEFSIDKWNDYDILPEVGSLVTIDDEGFIAPIKDSSKEKLEKLEKVKQKYLNGSIANGWKLINDNEAGFVIEESIFDYSYCIVLFIILSILLYFLLSFFGCILALIFSIMLAKKTTTLKGTYDYNAYVIYITKNDEFYKKLTI